MNNFAKILEEAFMERNEILKKQKELAEEILGIALKEFKYPNVCEVYIQINTVNDKTQIWVVPIGGIETKFSDLSYAQVVYKIIKEILSSEDDEEIEYLEDKLIINMFDDERGIQFKIEDDA